MAKINDLKELDVLDMSATYLLLISPEYIPHLALVKDGKYFSLTHKKAFVNDPFEPYFNFLKRSNRKMIFIELEENVADPSFVFGNYEKATVGATTCLMPIKDCVLPESNAGFIFELVPELYLNKKIRATYHLNMENDLTDLGDFNLSEYSKEAIFSYIESLNEKYAKRG